MALITGRTPGQIHRLENRGVRRGLEKHDLIKANA